MSPALHRGASRCNSRRACDALMLREEFLRDSEQRNTKLVDKNKRICGQTNNFDRQTNKKIHAQTNWRLTTSSTAAPNANPVPLSPAQTGAPPLRREFQPRLGSRSEASGVGANLLHRTIRTLNTITRTLNSIIRTLNSIICILKSIIRTLNSIILNTHTQPGAGPDRQRQSGSADPNGLRDGRGRSQAVGGRKTPGVSTPSTTR